MGVGKTRRVVSLSMQSGIDSAGWSMDNVGGIARFVAGYFYLCTEQG